VIDEEQSGMLQIRAMTAGDIAMGMSLKHQAGWNQLDADWLRFLAMQPDGCFVAELNGVPVGTTVAVVFDSIPDRPGPVAWIAMVLVDPGHRNRGVGTALMEHALKFLDARKVPSIRLDATPLGQPIYEKLGFTHQFLLARHEGMLPLEVAESIDETDGRIIQSVPPDEHEQLIELDSQLTGTGRRKFLARLFKEHPDSLRIVSGSSGIEGYLAVRPGSNAVQIGPCIARPEAGSQLFRDAARRYAGKRVYIDIPVGNSRAAGHAVEMGLKVQRHLVRMCRGVPVMEDDLTRLWASSGPELG
jgi:GNAT superfamily N-acetyltransferase